MALDIQRMMAQLQPARALDFGTGRSSAERERLKLAREQFEQAKKEHEEDKELRRVEEQGRNARQKLEAAEKLRQEEAARQATLLAQQQSGLQKFGEAAGSGKVQAAQAMSPFLDQLGYNVNNLGDVGGLPVFQLQNRAQEAERAAAALPPPGMNETAEQSALRLQTGDIGYPTNERGNLDDPSSRRAPTATDEQVDFDPGDGSLDEATSEALNPGDADMATAAEYGGDDSEVSVGRGMVPASLSQGDAYAQALAASQAARLNGGQPVRGPDEEDWTGAVPRNVIDLPAMNAETNARLNPMLKSITGSLPSELQPGAEAAAKAAAGLGLEATDAAAEYKKAIDPALDIYKGEQNIKAQKEKNNQLSRMDKSMLQSRGATKLEDLYKERAIDKSLNSIKKADEVDLVLKNDNREDDGMVANAVMEAQNLKGAPSNTDLEFAFGIKKGSLLTQGLAIIEEAVAGGMSDPQKAAVKSYMEAVRSTQKRNLDEYLDNAFDTIDSDTSLDPEERAGFKSRLERSVPASVYNSYWDERDKREKASGARRGSGGRSAPVDAGDLDSEKLGRVIGHESQGDATATSSAGASGTMQIMPENLRAMGIEPEDFKKLSPEEQMPYNVRYLKGNGITKDSSAQDYALAVAAPAFIGKPADTVVYPKSDDPKSAWGQNPGWRPAGGGDITVGSILKFYGLDGSADKAPSGPSSKASSEAPSKQTKLELPAPRNATEKRIRDLLMKKGG